MRNGRRGYDVALLTVAEPGRRNRRTIDALLLAFAALWTDHRRGRDRQICSRPG